MHKKIFFEKKFLTPKTLKNVIFGPKNREKMAKSKILVEKIFLVGIDSECFETYFKTKISKSKIFSRVKFFSWDLVVFRPK